LVFTPADSFAIFRAMLFGAEEINVINRSGSDAGRIRPDDVLIRRPQVQQIMGGISTSSVYDDPALMALKINLTPAESPHAVRWIEREVYELRAQRAALSAARGAVVAAQTEKRRALRRAKQRTAAATHLRPEPIGRKA
jgi:predicted DNA-binding transcriptional regulator AlpA